jgi:hypothetical protein
MWRKPLPEIRQIVERSRHTRGRNQMAIHSVHCPVLGAHVTQVTDLEGAVTRIICTEYDGADRSCRLKMSARESGPLGQWLERVSEDTLDTRSTRCVMLTT